MAARDLTDPKLNALYEEVQQGRPYGRSGINFLPEMVLYVLAGIASHAVSLRHIDKRPLTLLDYGAGRSWALDCLGHVLSPNLKYLKELQAGRQSVRAMFAFLEQDIYQWMHSTGDVPPLNDPRLKLLKYDPAVPEMKELPTDVVDFVFCTDVLEHIPVRGADGAPVLKNVMENITHISRNFYLNISCRSAMQVLPDGQNAHCTILPPAEWEKLVRDNMMPGGTPAAYQVFSRDATSCAFFGNNNIESLVPDLGRLAYHLLERFGPVDLIEWPTHRTDLSVEKQNILQAMQPHKHQVQKDYIAYWAKEGGLAMESDAFRQHATRILRAAAGGASTAPKPKT